MELQVNGTAVVSFVSALIALFAVAITYGTYKRNRTLDNENQLFKYKLERYNELLKMMVGVHTFFRKVITDFYFKYTDSMTDKVFDLKTEELETETMKMEMQLLVNSAFLPVSVVNKVQDYIEKLFTSDMLYCTEEDEYNTAIETLDDTYELILDTADAMRYDLGVDGLDSKLVIRTVGKKNRPKLD